MKKHLLILFILIITPSFSKEDILIVSNLSNNYKINNPIISGILENKSLDQNIQIEYVNKPKENSTTYMNSLNNLLKIKYKDFDFKKIIFLENKEVSLSKELFKDNRNKIIVDVSGKEKGIDDLISIIIKVQPGIKKIYIPGVSLKKLVDFKKKFYPIDFESFSLNFLYLKRYLELMNHENTIILTNSNLSWEFKNYLNNIDFPIYAYNINKNNIFALSYIENYYLLGSKLISSENNSVVVKEDEVWLNLEKAKKFNLKYNLIKKKKFLYNTNANFFLINKDRFIILIIFILSLLVFTFIIFLIKWKHIIIKLESLKRKAEASSLSKSKFLENMSHDMKTPLNTIANSVELMKNKREENLLNVISSSSYYLKDVINDILTLSELGNNVSNLNLKEIDLRGFIQEIYEICYTLTYRNNLYFYIYLNKDITFKTDKTKLKQILINLINNAFKFTKKGGIIISIDVLNDKIIFNIKDTGKGINLKIQDKIFEDFYRDKSQTIEGSGLGLAISKRYSNLLNSHLYLYKSNNKGSHFILEYPLEKRLHSTKGYFNTYFIYTELSKNIRKFFNEHHLDIYTFYDLEELGILIDEFNNENINIIVPKSFEIKVKCYNKVNINILYFDDSYFYEDRFNPVFFYNFYKNNAKIEISNKIYKENFNILIVEDNLLSAQLLIKNIKNIGINCYHAKNSEEIFKYIKKSTLILMDIGLDFEDGYELSKFFKREFPDKFIVGLSASQKHNGSNDSLDDFLEKPIDFKKLETIISLVTMDIKFYLKPLSKEHQNLFTIEFSKDLDRFNRYYKQENLNIKGLQKTIHKIKGYFLSINCHLISNLLNEAENTNYKENFYSVKFSYILLNSIKKELELNDDEHINSRR